jgi:DNA-binding NarL/FixJ family response regulator
MRAGAPARRLATSLQRLAARCDARLVSVHADHAAARAADSGPDLLRVADQMEQIGALRYATEAAAHAADALAREGRQNSARQAALRSRDLNARGQHSALPTMVELDNTAVKLTRRESQLVQLASRGLSNADIAERLTVSIRTVESHLYHAMQKLGVNDRHDL